MSPIFIAVISFSFDSMRECKDFGKGTNKRAKNQIYLEKDNVSQLCMRCLAKNKSAKMA
jgi:hypothetical protein